LHHNSISPFQQQEKKRKEKQLLLQEIFSYHFSLFYEMHHRKKYTNFEFHTRQLSSQHALLENFQNFQEIIFLNGIMIFS